MKENNLANSIGLNFKLELHVLSLSFHICLIFLYLLPPRKITLWRQEDDADDPFPRFSPHLLRQKHTAGGRCLQFDALEG